MNFAVSPRSFQKAIFSSAPQKLTGGQASSQTAAVERTAMDQILFRGTVGDTAQQMKAIQDAIARNDGAEILRLNQAGEIPKHQGQVIQEVINAFVSAFGFLDKPVVEPGTSELIKAETLYNSAISVQREKRNIVSVLEDLTRTYDAFDRAIKVGERKAQGFPYKALVGLVLTMADPGQPFSMPVITESNLWKRYFTHRALVGGERMILDQGIWEHVGPTTHKISLDLSDIIRLDKKKFFETVLELADIDPAAPLALRDRFNNNNLLQLALNHQVTGDLFRKLLDRFPELVHNPKNPVWGTALFMNNLSAFEAIYNRIEQDLGPEKAKEVLHQRNDSTDKTVLESLMESNNKDLYDSHVRAARRLLEIDPTLARDVSEQTYRRGPLEYAKYGDAVKGNGRTDKTDLIREFLAKTEPAA